MRKTKLSNAMYRNTPLNYLEYFFSCSSTCHPEIRLIFLRALSAHDNHGKKELTTRIMGVYLWQDSILKSFK